MGRKLIALLAAVSLSTAACGGGDKKESGATDTTVAPGDTTTTTAAGTGDPLTAGGNPAGGQSGGTASPSSPGAGAAGATTTTAKPANTTSTTRTAAPGRYTYQRTGTASGFGGDRSLDGEGTLTVDPANGNEQHSVTDFVGDTIEQTLRHRPGGIDLLHLRQTTSGVTFEFRPSPPALFAPDPANVGATWSWRMTSTDGGLTIDGSFKVVRNETVAVGSEAVPTTVVEGDLRFSGTFTGTSKQTLWGSDRYRLVVRTEEATDLGFAKRQSRSVLVSTKPA
ncbi:MAG TPA: hypothetical protein VM938_14520 [Acidimicrobiales bacterium]|nr:hypothetical protein [Acidimicrobiales bacterium]